MGWGGETAALVRAARTGGLAPSIHNTQPWRWTVGGNAMDLYAVRARQLPITDPGGCMLTLSCGAALHHARVALAAEGWRAEVTRLPDPDSPDLLARVTAAEPVPVPPEALRRLAALRVRRTDRRPVSAAPVAESTLAAMTKAASDEGARLKILGPEQVLDLAAVAAEAQRVEDLDPSWRNELSYWAGRGRREGTGIPEEVIPRERPATTVPGRDLGRGTLEIDRGHDQAARYAILHTDEDAPLGWLRSGEALSALWLAATERGTGVVPLSTVVDVPSTREALRRLLSGIGTPMLALRIGVPDADHAAPPHTPRLPLDQAVEIVN